MAEAGGRPAPWLKEVDRERVPRGKLGGHPLLASRMVARRPTVVGPEGKVPRSMNCPVCQKQMVTEDFGGVSVDVCRDGCKGIWFDWFELSKLDEKNEGMGAALQEALDYPRTNDANRGPINCPKCSVPLHRHLCTVDKEVSVDECYDCGGFFLDSGELKDIRARSEERRVGKECRL